MASWLPILTFHAIDRAPSVISFPPERFRAGIGGLRAAGLRVIDLLDAAGRARSAWGIPRGLCVLTFDDGFRSVYEEAFPVLVEHGMPATVFVTAGGPGGRGGRPQPFLGREMLSPREMREMAEEGIRFGAHTLTHPDLTRLPTPRAREEIVGSKRRVEDWVGQEVSAFAYPFGRLDRRIAGIVRAHFACACTDRLGLVTRRSDPLALPRVDAWYLRFWRSLAPLGSGLLPWFVWLRNVPRTLRRRLGLWRP